MDRLTKAYDVVVLGGANWDYLVRGSTLPKESQTIEGRTFHEGPGGKGANQAVAAARLGARVAFVGCVGQDERGEQILRQLAKEGIDVSNVRRTAEAATGIALIMVDQNGKKQIITAPGANHEVTARDVTYAETSIGRAGVLVVQFEVPMAAVSQAIAIARDAGVRVFLDPAPPQTDIPQSLLRGIDLIKPNSAEAEALTGVEVRDRASAREAARELLARGVKAVVIEAGSEGNLLLTPERETFLPRIHVESVDATGAGDAFMGGLAVLIAEGKSLEAAARFGNAAAALKTKGLGAQAPLPRRDEVEGLFTRLGAIGGKYDECQVHPCVNTIPIRSPSLACRPTWARTSRAPASDRPWLDFHASPKGSRRSATKSWTEAISLFQS